MSKEFVWPLSKHLSFFDLGDGLGICKFSYGAKEMMLDNAQKVSPQTTYHCVNWPNRSKRFKVTKNFWAWNVCQCQFFRGGCLGKAKTSILAVKYRGFIQVMLNHTLPSYPYYWLPYYFLVNPFFLYNLIIRMDLPNHEVKRNRLISLKIMYSQLTKIGYSNGPYI